MMTRALRVAIGPSCFCIALSCGPARRPSTCPLREQQSIFSLFAKLIRTENPTAGQQGNVSTRRIEGRGCHGRAAAQQAADNTGSGTGASSPLDANCSAMAATQRLQQLTRQLCGGDGPNTSPAAPAPAAATATDIAARLMANGATLPFSARRSAVYATHGMVACSQPAASEIGLRILQSGGNAIDAAVAIGAALNLTEGMSTGLGGDCFILFKPAGDPKVYALNGSGRAAASLTSAKVREDCAKTYGIADPDSIEEFPGDRTASRKSLPYMYLTAPSLRPSLAACRGCSLLPPVGPRSYRITPLPLADGPKN